MWRIVIGVLSPTMFLSAQSFVSAPHVCVAGKTIASKRVKDVIVLFINEQGNFTGGDNRYCIEFNKAKEGGPVEVRDVRMHFSQLVGRMQERPIIAQVTQDSVGRYFGSVNLGRQYYNPAAYYAILHYVDSSGKKKKARFLLRVK
jgi:hypothetical protein